MPKVAIAPMLDWTDRHYRYFMRKITANTILYTEMIVADAIIHGNQNNLLEHNVIEHPLIIQLGGSNPDKLVTASQICEQYGYTGINLNVGCPSDRVKSGKFGACLMNDAHLVGKCLIKMQKSVSIPVSIKQRIGLGYNEDYNFLKEFVQTIQEYGITQFIIHARNAILGTLTPKQNREIPPLRYDYVYQLKTDFPHLNIMINGGIKTIDEIKTHLQYVDGVMIGREAYYNPYLFNKIEQFIIKSQTTYTNRLEIAHSMIDYLLQAQERHIPLHHITRHMIGLYHGCNKAKIWRYQLTNEMIRTNSMDTYYKLLKFMEDSD